MIDFDFVLERIGNMGRFQIIAYLLLAYFGIPAGISALASVFISYTPSYRCNLPAEFENVTASLNLTEDDILNYTTPYDGDEYNGCKRYSYNYSACDGDLNCVNKSAPLVDCDNGYHYDDSLFTKTTVTERVLNAVGGSMYMVGMLLGSMIFGNLSDLFGRKPTTVGGALATLAVMCGLSFVTNFTLFAIGRCLIALFIMGSYITVFTYVLEMVGKKWRTLIGVSFQISFSLGYMIWSGIAYRWRDWHQMQLVSFIICIPCIIPPIILPESARWLFNKNKEKQGKKVVATMAKYNRAEVTDELWEAATKSAESKNSGQSRDSERKYSTIDLFRGPLMRIMTLKVMFNWAVNSLVYYGISLNAGSLAGSIFINNIYAGVLEIGSYIFCILTLDIFGRRKLLCFTLTLAGVALLISTTVNEFTDQNPTLVSVGVIMAFVGKAAISGSFAIIYNYTSELYPTSVRTNAMGIGSTGARVGSILAPFVIDLQDYVSWLPNTILGVLSIIAGVMSIFFPETKGHKMLESLDEAEEFYAGKSSGKFQSESDNFGYDNHAMTEKPLPHTRL